MNFFVLEYGQLESYESILDYHYPHAKLSYEFLLTCTHEDLLRMPHPLL